MANQRPEPDKASKLRLGCIKSLMRSPEADDQNFKMQILTNSDCLRKYRTYGLVVAIQANENVCSIKLKIRKITVEHPAYSFQNRLFISPTAYQLEREQKCDLCTRNLETSTFWTTRRNHKI